MNRRLLVAITVSALFTLLLISATSTITVKSSMTSIGNIYVTVGNGFGEHVKHSLLSPLNPSRIFREVSWITVTNRLRDDFEDADLSGWMWRLKLLNATSSSSCQALTKTVAKYNGYYGAYVEAILYLPQGASRLDGVVEFYRPLSISGVNMITLDGYMAPLTLGIWDKVEIRPYIVVNNVTIQASNCLQNQGWGRLTYTFTVNSTQTVTEAGYRIYWLDSTNPPSNQWGYVYFDDVVIELDQPKFEGVTVTLFQVTADINIYGRNVKASANSPLNTCNYTIRIYHAVDSLADRTLAYTVTVSNVTVPYTYTAWSSGWLPLKTASATGSHTYYVGIELEVKGLDAFTGNIISDSQLIYIWWYMLWQNTWLPKTFTTSYQASGEVSINVPISIIGICVLASTLMLIYAARTGED